MLMKERAKSKGRALRRENNQSDHSEISNCVNSNQSILSSTTLDVSMT